MRHPVISCAALSGALCVASVGGAQEYVYVVGTNNLTYSASVTYDLEAQVITEGVSGSVYTNYYGLDNGNIVGWYNDPDLGQSIAESGLDMLDDSVFEYGQLVDEAQSFSRDFDLPDLTTSDDMGIYDEHQAILDALQDDTWDSLSDLQATQSLSLAVEAGQEIQLGIHDIDEVPDSSILFPTSRRSRSGLILGDQVQVILGAIFSGFDAFCETLRTYAVWWRLLMRAGFSALILRRLWVITRQIGLEIVHSVADALAGRRVGVYSYSSSGSGDALSD